MLKPIQRLAEKEKLQGDLRAPYGFQDFGALRRGEGYRKVLEVVGEVKEGVRSVLVIAREIGGGLGVLGEELSDAADEVAAREGVAAGVLWEGNRRDFDGDGV